MGPIRRREDAAAQQRLRAQHRLSKIASPHLHRLRQRIGWPSDLAVLDGESMLIIVTSREFNVVALNYKAGARAPVIASSLGRAYVAFCEAETRNRLLEILFVQQRGKRAYSLTTRKKAELMLAGVRKNGYAMPDPAFKPILGRRPRHRLQRPVLVEGVAVASLSVAFLESAVTPKQASERCCRRSGKPPRRLPRRSPRTAEPALRFGEALRLHEKRDGLAVARLTPDQAQLHAELELVRGGVDDVGDEPHAELGVSHDHDIVGDTPPHRLVRGWWMTV